MILLYILDVLMEALWTWAKTCGIFYLISQLIGFPFSWQLGTVFFLVKLAVEYAISEAKESEGEISPEELEDFLLALTEDAEFFELGGDGHDDHGG